ncbi:MAG: BMP family ABC transporter substrate-binding protein [Rhizobiales bacterium]|nr:BMP family ABC transporter substrate-binding protein [Hyphomicrobiales bacterium]NRB15343.1 BMP family ABC transporter substrate-binding protein [Hyphomicrobiales bacterium]
MKNALRLVMASAITMTASYALAEIKPGMIYDMGGKFDKSFNESAYNGVQAFTASTGIVVKEFEIQAEAQREQILRKFAKDGYSPIAVTGFTFGTAIGVVAAEYPDTQFTIIDAVVDLPNVQSVVFTEHEGSYLVGYLAAQKSETKKVGFIGGMVFPVIQKFECGYYQGAIAGGATDVFSNMVGTSHADAWGNPTKAAELTKSQFSLGADVVFAAAGGSGLGTLQAAKDAGKLAIGVDSNQNHIQPGSVLTSMVKRVDNAVSDAFTTSKDGTWKSGLKVMGITEGGISWALDDNNSALISDDLKAAMDALQARIVAGEIKVHNTDTDGPCPT